MKTETPQHSQALPNFFAWLNGKTAEGTTVTIDGWPDLGQPSVLIAAGGIQVGCGDTLLDAIISMSLGTVHDIEANAAASADAVFEALKETSKELDTWHNWQLATNPEYPKSNGAARVREILVKANAILQRIGGQQ